MPVPAIIVNAAENFSFNSDLLPKMVGDLSAEELLRRPSEKSNHIVWIVGHMMWARKGLLGLLGTQWSQPWIDSFAIHAKCDNGAAYPSPDALVGAWREASGVLAGALGNVSENALAQPSKNPHAQPSKAGPPSLDGKISGVVKYLAIHEIYHVGQVSYLRHWLGHKGLI